MVGPCGGEKQCFGLYAPPRAGGRKQQVADHLRSGGAAGFPGEQRVYSPLGQRLDQQLGLRGLANPLAAFEGDEAGSFLMGAHRNNPAKPLAMRRNTPASSTSSAA